MGDRRRDGSVADDIELPYCPAGRGQHAPRIFAGWGSQSVASRIRHRSRERGGAHGRPFVAAFPTIDTTIRTTIPGHHQVRGFRRAVRLLEDVDDRSPIERLTVSAYEPDRSLSRFVSLLRQREGGRIVRQVSFIVDWSGFPDGDMESLFRDALPDHPTLESISFFYTHRLPTRFLRMLTEALPTTGVTPLSVLSTRGSFGADSAIKTQVVQALVEMLQRNPTLPQLEIGFDLDADQCKLICQALPHNANLRALKLNVNEIDDYSLDGVATSSLGQLQVSGSFSDDNMSSLVMQLRTNETLRDLRLVHHFGNGNRDSHALLDFVRNYNYTLHSLTASVGLFHNDEWVRTQVQHYMRRNARVRVALQNLQDPSRREVMSVNLAPRVLGLVSELPTVLCRILKMGYLVEVSERLAEQETASTLAATTIEEGGDEPSVSGNTEPDKALAM